MCISICNVQGNKFATYSYIALLYHCVYEYCVHMLLLPACMHACAGTICILLSESFISLCQLWQLTSLFVNTEERSRGSSGSYKLHAARHMLVLQFGYWATITILGMSVAIYLPQVHTEYTLAIVSYCWLTDHRLYLYVCTRTYVGRSSKCVYT